MRCKVLWISCGCMAAVEVFSVLSRWREGVELGSSPSIDSGFFLFALPAGVLSALVCAFFAGPEYSDGTMRNKIAAGCRRQDVFLANVLLTALASVVMCLAAILPGLALGLPLLGGFHMGAAQAVGTVLGICVTAVTYAVPFAAVMMLVDRRTVSSAAVLVAALVLLGVGGYLRGRLDALPVVEGNTVSVDGELVETEPLPNPEYFPEGPARDAVQFLCDCFPGGQTVQYAALMADRPVRMMVCDAAIIAAVGAGGMALFRRKDLK